MQQVLCINVYFTIACVFISTAIPSTFHHVQVYFLHAKYFSSMSAIILTILDIINERILPLSAKGYEVYILHHSCYFR